MSKLFIASDIHGSAKYCRLLLDAFKREGATQLILLGDILYHGPRNPLPEEYAPPKVVELLSAVKDKIMCVRGNCDGEVDQMVLPFPITPDYCAVLIDGHRIYLSHGHREVPPMTEGDVYITGHTHIPVNENLGYLHLNPGSVSLPKENTGHGYILYADGTFYFKDLNGKVYDKAKI
ncbi:MAG: phosphodiesterase [Clostridia bacterium]|nr:phosphodiesterase [Clostridia bacterium]